MQQRFEDAELGIAQMGLGNALLGVGVQGVKGFHQDQPDVDAAVVWRWGAPLSAHPEKYRHKLY
jgi:hypothetical protein